MKSAREKANDYFANTLYSRLDRKTDGVISVVMQRLHDEDLVGGAFSPAQLDVGDMLSSSPTTATKDSASKMGQNHPHDFTKRPLAFRRPNRKDK